MDVLARPADGVDVGVDSFADLTTVVVTAVGWESEGWLRVTFDGDLTPAEITAVRRRMVSRSPAEEALRAEAAAYLDTEGHVPKVMDDQIRRLTRLLVTPDFEEPV